MGLFLSVTAVQHARADDVANLVESWFSDHFAVCTETTGRDVPGGSRVDVHAPVDVAPRWRGDPETVAALLGCHARDVARHYRRNRRDRTFDDWGFVAVWADEGITYPDPPGTHATYALGDDWFDVLHRVLGTLTRRAGSEAATRRGARATPRTGPGRPTTGWSRAAGRAPRGPRHPPP